LRRGSVRLWLAFILVLAVLAGAGYWVIRDLGKPQGSTSKGAAVSSSNGSLKALSDEQLERMVSQATAMTQKDAKNASAWAMLAHSYEMMGKFSESALAYAKLAQLLPQDAQVLADYADVLAVAQGRSFKGEPLALLQRSLALDAKNVKALLLTGSAYAEERDIVQARLFLEKARAATTDPAMLRQIDASMAQLGILSGDAAPAAAASAPGGAEIAGAAAQLSGRVWLADSLRGKAPADATVFVYARPVQGSRMPVALLRKKLSELPLDFTLTDAMAMTPNASLSKTGTVVVVARVSLRANVTPAPGDLEGVSAPVAVGTKNLKLEISEVLK
jgi:cytochrome c-type biogenesis protein CcmH